MFDQNVFENPDYPYGRGLPMVMDNPNPKFKVGDWVIANEWIASKFYLRRKTRVIQTRLLKTYRKQPPTDQVCVAGCVGQWFAASHFTKVEDPPVGTVAPLKPVKTFLMTVDAPKRLVEAISITTFNQVQDVKAWFREKPPEWRGELSSVIVWADRAVRLGLLKAAQYFVQFDYIDPDQIGKDLLGQAISIPLVSEEQALRRLNTLCNTDSLVCNYGSEDEQKYVFDLYEVMRVQYERTRARTDIEKIPPAILSREDVLTTAKTRMDEAKKNLDTMESIHRAVHDQYPETSKMDYAGKRARDMASANLGAAKSEYLYLMSVYTRLSVA